MSFFESFSSMWSPMYSPNSKIKSRFIGCLPYYFEIAVEQPDVLHYCGKNICRINVEHDVREDGPMAWGTSLNIREGAYFRWGPNESEPTEGWNLAEETRSIDIETGGHTLETLTMNENGDVTWVLHIFNAI